MGTFSDIGYAMDTSANFSYATNINSSKAALTETAKAWYATSKSALNDCPKAATWNLKLSPSSTGNGAAWEASYSNESACSVLTPRFKDLTRGTAASGSDSKTESKSDNT